MHFHALNSTQSLPPWASKIGSVRRKHVLGHLPHLIRQQTPGMNWTMQTLTEQVVSWPVPCFDAEAPIRAACGLLIDIEGSDCAFITRHVAAICENPSLKLLIFEKSHCNSTGPLIALLACGFQEVQLRNRRGWENAILRRRSSNNKRYATPSMAPKLHSALMAKGRRRFPAHMVFHRNDRI